MNNMEGWSKAALFDEWWNLISGDDSSAIKDKILLSRHYGLPVEGFGDTPGVRFDPFGGPESENFTNYRLLEEVLTRTCKFPSENLGRYIGIVGEPRAQIQWCLMTMYNMGFEAAIKAIEKMDKTKE